MKKIALLVLAAYNPANICWLVDQLSDEFIIYIHIDKKENGENFLQLRQKTNVRLISDRVDVFWAGFSMVEASINLISTALAEKGIEFSHLCLISDDTLPLYGPARLALRLRETGLDWIETWEIPEGHPFQERYRRFYYLDSKFSSPRWFLTEERNVEERDVVNVAALMELKNKGKYRIDKLYAGKQWWVLSARTAQELLDFHCNEKHLQASFRYSAVADEIYFQTIYKILYSNKPKMDNPMLFDFSREPKPFEFSTATQILQFHGYQAKRSDFLFVRKTRFAAPTMYEDYRHKVWSEPSRQVVL